MASLAIVSSSTDDQRVGSGKSFRPRYQHALEFPRLELCQAAGIGSTVALQNRGTQDRNQGHHLLFAEILAGEETMANVYQPRRRAVPDEGGRRPGHISANDRRRP